MPKKIKSKINIKVVLRSLVLILIVFAISSVIMYQRTYEKFETNLSKEISLRSQLVNHAIFDFFETNRNTIDLLAVNEDIEVYLKEVKSRDEMYVHPLYKKIERMLKNITDNNKYSSSYLWIAHEEANFYFGYNSHQDLSTYDVKTRPWRKEALSSKDTVLTEPYQDYGSDQQVLSTVRTIRDGEKIIGFIGIDMKLINLPDIMQSYVLGENGINFLVNYHNDYIYSPAGHWDDEFKDILMKKVDDKKKNPDQLQQIKHRGNTFFVYYNQLDINNWGIVQLIDKDEFTDGLYNFLRLIWIVFFIAGLMLLSIIVKDGISQKLLENNLRNQARTDALTGSNNRGYFMELALDKFHIAKLEDRNYNFLMIDIDYFKSVNDNYGHHVGDIVLENMAKLSVHSLGDHAIFGRLGGEEFAAVILDIEKEAALLAAERLRKQISEMNIITDCGNVSINVSIGLTWMTDEDQELEDVLKRADEAMYDAKRCGRNKVKLK